MEEELRNKISELLEESDYEMTALLIRDKDLKEMVNVLTAGIQMVDGRNEDKYMFCLKEYILPLMDIHKNGNEE